MTLLPGFPERRIFGFIFLGKFRLAIRETLL